MIEPDYLADVLSAACDIALVVNDQGAVVSLITSSLTDLSPVAHWESNPLEMVLTIESIGKFQSILAAFRDGEAMPRSVELNHLAGEDGQFPVRYATFRISDDGHFLMLGQDLRQVAASQQHLVQAQIALEREHEERRDYDARYRLLMGAARDAFVVMSVADGHIHDLNISAANILGTAPDALIGTRLSDQLGGVSEDLNAQLRNPSGAMITAEASRTDQTLLISRAAFRVSGVPMMLCRLDPESHATVRDPLDDRLRALFHTGHDGIVLTNAAGEITWANDMFLELAGVAQPSDVTGRSLASYLARGALDLEVLTQTTAETGRVRNYTTWMTDSRGGRRPVDISATYLTDGPDPSLGVVLRDAPQVATTPATPDGDTSASGAARLVGQAPLKEIVAATTDVIERICIETALDLTRNNRAAAADMLGLSRQSLYIKLRKLGLIDPKDGS